MTTNNDIVLIHLEDSPVSYARVESILPDAKKDWYQIKLLMLQVPLQTVTWILKDAYINGDEFFMNGKRMKLVKVESPFEETETAPPPKKSVSVSADKDESADSESTNVISFSDFKKES